MAKRFGGFTPEQMGKIIPEMQGMQADEQAKFLASQPGAAARVGRMAELAQQRIGMAAGGMAKKQGYAPGGLTLKTGQTYKNTYSGGVEAKGSHSTDNDKPGNPPLNTPNTTGGFDMVQPITKPRERPKIDTPGYGQPTLPVEPEYDPTQGLPEIPVDPITEEKLEEYTSGIPSWANKVKDLFSSGEIPEDTTDWKVTGGKRNYTLEFKDGTKIPLTLSLIHI